MQALLSKDALILTTYRVDTMGLTGKWMTPRIGEATPEAPKGWNGLLSADSALDEAASFERLGSRVRIVRMETYAMGRTPRGLVNRTRYEEHVEYDTAE